MSSILRSLPAVVLISPCESILVSSILTSLPAVVLMFSSVTILLLSTLILFVATAFTFSSDEISDSLTFRSSSALKVKSLPVSTELSEILTLLLLLISVSSPDSMLTSLDISMASDKSPVP